MRTGVVTPEAVVLELPTAGVASRALARLVDLLVQLLAGLILYPVAAVFISLGLGPALVVLLLVVFVFLAVPIGIEIIWRGRSPGKAMFGLSVVGADGSPEAPRQAAVRGLIAIVDLYVSLGFLAVATATFTPATQRPGDLAAGTVVIRSRRAGRTDVPIAFHPPAGYEDYIATLDVSALDEEDFSLIRELLLRVRELEPEARAVRTRSLAEGVRVRIRHTLPAPVDPELWLVCVASAYQQRRGGLLADAALGLAPLAPITPTTVGRDRPTAVAASPENR